jgi:hypothetical protein
MGAAALETPELKLDESEAKTLAQAIGNVAAYYPISIDPKTLVWANLIMVCGAIYGSRAIAIFARKKQEENRTIHVAGNNAKSDNIIRGSFDPMAVQAGKIPPL